MTAPVRVTRAPLLGNIDDFVECCADHAWYHAEGWISLQFAADNLQALAERWGLVDENGQDEVQRCMCEAFMPLPEMPSDYAAQLIRQWELDDPRDRSRWTGEMPPVQPTETKKPPAYAPAASTIDAFAYVVRLGEPAYLAAWLATHPADAPHLLRDYEANHVVA